MYYGPAELKIYPFSIVLNIYICVHCSGYTVFTPTNATASCLGVTRRRAFVKWMEWDMVNWAQCLGLTSTFLPNHRWLGHPLSGSLAQTCSPRVTLWGLQNFGWNSSVAEQTTQASPLQADIPWIGNNHYNHIHTNMQLQENVYWHKGMKKR